MTGSEDLRLKRLYWRSNHRGCKETDIVLGRFASGRLSELSPNELDSFEALLDEDDADIWGWLVEKIAIPDHYRVMVQAVRAYGRE